MAPKKKAAKGGKKNRKIGRNEKKCQRYRALGKLVAAKKKRIARHLDDNPNDSQARSALDRI